jgi:hypothetical protein
VCAAPSKGSAAPRPPQRDAQVVAPAITVDCDALTSFASGGAAPEKGRVMDGYLEAKEREMALRGRKKPRRRKMVVIVIEDDPRIGRKQKATMSRAQRQPMRGDRIGESEEAIWLNAGMAAGR